MITVVTLYLGMGIAFALIHAFLSVLGASGKAFLMTPLVIPAWPIFLYAHHKGWL
jgi:hypothetical protein